MNVGTTLYKIGQAQLVQRDYVCAGCWGQLSIFPVKGSQDNRVTCLICGDERGFVTRGYAERRQQDSIAEYREARENLKGVLPAVEPSKTEKELLSELGF